MATFPPPPQPLQQVLGGVLVAAGVSTTSSVVVSPVSIGIDAVDWSQVVVSGVDSEVLNTPPSSSNVEPSDCAQWW